MFEQRSNIFLPLCELGCTLRTHHHQWVLVGLMMRFSDSWLRSSAASPFIESFGVCLLQAQDALAACRNGVGEEGGPQGWGFHTLCKAGCSSKSSQMQTGWSLPKGVESELVFCGSETFHLPQLSHVSLAPDDPAVLVVFCCHAACTHSRVVAGSVWMLPCTSQTICHPVPLAQQTLPLARCRRCIALSHSRLFSKSGSGKCCS